METTEEANDLGTLVYERPTLYGFGIALYDIAIMACYLAGALSCVRLFGDYGVIDLQAMATLAIGLLLLERWINVWFRITHPKGNYEYKRKFVNGNRTTTKIGVHIWDDE